tara:strand:- start:464 stop:649 length:186 start_codon:yes stop_codon:yes gene_type:complete
MAHCGTKRKKKGMGGPIGDYKNDIGNKFAKRENRYGGGKVQMKKGGQPMYKHGECPKGKAC